MYIKYKIIFLCLIVSFINAQNKNAFPVQLKINNGIIEGKYDTHTGIQTYFGVPFAAPPIGPLRWKAPQPHENWDGVKQTKFFAPRPMQPLIFGDMKSRSDGLSEDCLYLNIWTPALSETKGLPVLVYFYGGGNMAGDASEYRYDGESMAKNGVIMVTVNYRLNIFGFLSHPELSDEAPYKGSGNYGFLDQSLAIKWVSDNIQYFGGDPNKITIAGESAGSSGVSLQMSSPTSSLLIAGAIGESGSSILRPVPLDEGEKIGLELIKKSKYNSIAELRSLSTREVYELYNSNRNFRFPTVIDGCFLIESPLETFINSKQAKVPLLVGWNSAEVGPSMILENESYTQENYQNKIKNRFPNEYLKILKLYPAKSEDEVKYAARDLASDLWMGYSTWKWFDLHRKKSNSNVFRYIYNKIRPPLVDQNTEEGLAGGTIKRTVNSDKRSLPTGACHSCEIEYALGNLDLTSNIYSWTEDDYKVSKTMQSYFLNFVKTGDPNGNNLEHWPSSKSNSKNPMIMNIDVQSNAIKAINDGRYLFLDQYYSKVK